MPSVGVILDHPNGVYYSGETLKGILSLTAHANENIKSVSFKIIGYGKVYWAEYRGTKNGIKSEQVFSTNEEYINSNSYIIGSDGGQPFDLAPGKYDHSFSYLLPKTLPTSYEGEHGEVKYEIVVTTDLPYTSDNICKQGFTVIQPLNLNLDETLKIPKNVNHLESPCWCCCCCGCGEINGELTVPVGGCIPGQKIDYEVFVFNDTDKDIGTVNLKLEKCVTFESHIPMRKCRKAKAEIYSKSFVQDIFRGQRKQIKDSIEIPSIPPSSAFSDQCLRIEYLLTATVVTGLCANDINLVIPIKIGTVPLIENPDGVITTQPTAPIIDQYGEGTNDLDHVLIITPLIDHKNDNRKGGGSDLPPAYLAEAPPLYDMPFVPKYPVYNNLPTSNESSDTEIPTNSSARDNGSSLEKKS